MIRLYRWPENNFGDELALEVCRAVGADPVVAVDDPACADLAAVGSIVQGLHGTGFAGAVWGSGAISDEFGPLRLPEATISAVRGRLTADLLGLDGDPVLGDPGLLAGLLVDAREEPRHEVGLVAHKVDRDEPAVRRVACLPGVRLVDVTAGPRAVLEAVADCRAVVSSALHGLVAADALGIPSRWAVVSGRVIGGGFKFRDYYSAFGQEAPPPIRLRGDEDAEILASRCLTVDRQRADAVRRRLVDAYPFAVRPEVAAQERWG